MQAIPPWDSKEGRVVRKNTQKTSRLIDTYGKTNPSVANDWKDVKKLFDELCNSHNGEMSTSSALTLLCRTNFSLSASVP